MSHFSKSHGRRIAILIASILMCLLLAIAAAACGGNSTSADVDASGTSSPATGETNEGSGGSTTTYTCPEGHTINGPVEVVYPATCIHPGTGVIYCELCKESFSVVIPADGVSHSKPGSDGKCEYCHQDVAYTVTENSDGATVTVSGVKDSTLDKIEIPGKIGDKSVKIAPEAFKGNANLQTVVIGNGALEIGASAFEGCSALADVTIPDTITSVGANAFAGTAFYTSNIEDGVVYISTDTEKTNNRILLTVTESALTPVTSAVAHVAYVMPMANGGGAFIVNASTQVIADEAFSGLTGLKSVTLPNGLVTLGNDAFKGCTGLESVVLPTGITNVNLLGGLGSVATTEHPVKVYYRGAEWEYDEAPANVTVWYYSTNEPTTEGNYWHEDEGVKEWAKLTSLTFSGEYKTNYLLNEALSTEELTVTANFNDGTTRALETGDYTYEITDEAGKKVTGPFTKTGTYTVTFTYRYITGSYEVVVSLHSYTVTIEYGNGAPNGSEVVYENEDSSENYTLPVAPARNGYTFTGWLVNGQTKQPAEKVTISADTTITAQWEAKKLENVTFALGEGAEQGTAKYEVGALTDGNYTITITGTPTREGYRFDGWTATLNGNDVTVSEQNTITVSLDDNMTVVITAKWTQLYTVTVSASNATVSLDPEGELDGKEYAEGESFTFTVTVANGYKLVSVENGETVLDVNEEGKYTVIVGTENITITVTTTEVNVTATVVGADVTATVTKSDNNSKATITVPTPTKTGYTFDGWTVKVGEESKEYTEGGLTIDLANSDVTVTFTANWTAKTPDVTLDYGESDGAQQNDAKYEVSFDEATSAYTITVSGTPTRAGYRFTGWTATLNEGNVEVSENKITVSLADNMTVVITAQWEIVGSITNAYNATLVGDPAFIVYVQYTGFDENTIKDVKLVYTKGETKVTADVTQADNGTGFFCLHFELPDLEIGEYTLSLEYNGVSVYSGSIGGGGTINVHDKQYTLADGKLTVSEIPHELTQAYNMHFENDSIQILVKGTFTQDEMNAMQLKIGDNISVPAKSAQKETDYYTVTFSLTDKLETLTAAANTYTLKLYYQANNYLYENLTIAGKDTYETTTATLKLTNNTLTVTMKQATYTVTVTANAMSDCSYTLVKQGTSENVETGTSVPAGTVLTLTLTLDDKHIAKVDVTGGSSTNEGNVYTITVSQDTTITITFSEKGEVVNIEASDGSHFYGDQYFQLYLSGDDYKILKPEGALSGAKVRVNSGTPVSPEYVGLYINIQVGTDNYHENLKLEWLDEGGNVIATTSYTAPGYEVTLTVTGSNEDCTYKLTYNGEDVKSGGKYEGTLTLNVKVSDTEKYSVVVKVNGDTVGSSDGVTGHEIHMEDGAVVISIEFTTKSEPTPAGTLTATEATLEKNGETVYFVLKGTASDYSDQAAVVSALQEVYFDLQELNKAGGYQTEFERSCDVQEYGQNFTWTLKFDITALEINANAYIVHFLPGDNNPNPGADLKLENSKAEHGFSVSTATKTFTLLNEYGESGPEHNYGCVAVKVEEYVHEHAFTNHDGKGNYTCECGAVLHPGEATGITLGADKFDPSIVESGLSVSFYVNTAILVTIPEPESERDQDDWTSHILMPGEGNIIITLPNLDPWWITDSLQDPTEEALAAKLRASNAFPDGTKGDIYNGGAWNSFNGSSYVTIVISKESGITFYRDGVKLISYAADRAIGTGTIADFAELFLRLTARSGLKVGTGAEITSVNDLYIEATTYTDEQAQARFTAYSTEKTTYPKHTEHTYVDGVCSVCGYVCVHTFTEADGACSVCGQYTGKQLASEDLGASTNGWIENSKEYIINKPSDGKTLEVVFSATFADDTVKRSYTGIVTRFYKEAEEQAFLQGNGFSLKNQDGSKPWKDLENGDRTIADFDKASKSGFFSRVIVRWEGTTISVTYELWAARSDTTLRPTKTGYITFTGVTENSYRVLFGLDGVTSTDAKLVVNEYSKGTVEPPKQEVTVNFSQHNNDDLNNATFDDKTYYEGDTVQFTLNIAEGHVAVVDIDGVETVYEGGTDPITVTAKEELTSTTTITVTFKTRAKVPEWHLGGSNLGEDNLRIPYEIFTNVDGENSQGTAKLFVFESTVEELTEENAFVVRDLPHQPSVTWAQITEAIQQEIIAKVNAGKLSRQENGYTLTFRFAIQVYPCDPLSDKVYESVMTEPTDMLGDQSYGTTKQITITKADVSAPNAQQVQFTSDGGTFEFVRQPSKGAAFDTWKAKMILLEAQNKAGTITLQIVFLRESRGSEGKDILGVYRYNEETQGKDSEYGERLTLSDSEDYDNGYVSVDSFDQWANSVFSDVLNGVTFASKSWRFRTKVIISPVSTDTPYIEDGDWSEWVEGADYGNATQTTVTFAVEEGKYQGVQGLPQETVVSGNDVLEKPSEIPTLDGHEFIGWYYKGAEGKDVDVWQDGGNFIPSTVAQGGKLTLYAKFAPVETAGTTMANAAALNGWTGGETVTELNIDTFNHVKASFPEGAATYDATDKTLSLTETPDAPEKNTFTVSAGDAAAAAIYARRIAVAASDDVKVVKITVTIEFEGGTLTYNDNVGYTSGTPLTVDGTSIGFTFSGSVKIKSITVSCAVSADTATDRTQERVDAALNAVVEALTNKTISVAGDVHLPATSNGVALTWSTENETYKVEDNVLKITALPKDADLVVTLTVTADGASAPKTVDVTIKGVHTSSVVLKDYADAHEWSHDTGYYVLTLDDNIEITIEESGLNGRWWSNDNTWRLYDGGKITFSAKNGAKIVALYLDYSESGLSSSLSSKQEVSVNGQENGSLVYTTTNKAFISEIRVKYVGGKFATPEERVQAANKQLEQLKTQLDGKILTEDYPLPTVTDKDVVLTWTVDGGTGTAEVQNGVLMITRAESDTTISVKVVASLGEYVSQDSYIFEFTIKAKEAGEEKIASLDAKVKYGNTNTDLNAVDIQVDDVTLTFEASAGQAPRYNKSGYIQMYGGNTLTIKVPFGYTIRKVVFTFSTNKTGDATMQMSKYNSSGTYSVSGTTGTWNYDPADDSTTELTFQNGTGSGQAAAQITTMAVTYFGEPREMTSQDKVNAVAKEYELPEVNKIYATTKEYDLPTEAGEATITWALKEGTSSYCSITADGSKLNVTSLPEKDTDVFLVATFHVDDATATKEFTVKIKAPSTGKVEELYVLDQSETGSNSSYNNNCDVTTEGITWNIEGHSQMTPWRFGGKASNKTTPLTANRALTGKSIIVGTVTEILLTLTDGGSITVNSVTIEVYSTDPTAEGATPDSTKSIQYQKGSEVSIKPDAAEDWTNCYFKFIFNVTVSSTSNKYVSISELKFMGTY